MPSQIQGTSGQFDGHSRPAGTTSSRRDDRRIADPVPLIGDHVELVRAEEAADHDPGEQAADVVVADAVPLGVAAQRGGTDQDADRDDDPERLDRKADVERSEMEVRQAGDRRGGPGRHQEGKGVHAPVSLHHGERRAMIAA
jgi:hypothetical protein